MILCANRQNGNEEWKLNNIEKNERKREEVFCLRVEGETAERDRGKERQITRATERKIENAPEY